MSQGQRTRYISLGSTCSVAKQLEILHLKRETLPFDWVRTPYFIDVLNLIKQKFNNYLVEENFIYQRSSDRHSLEQPGTSAVYEHSIYRIVFFHDFREDTDFKSQFEEFKERQQRRIDRFYSILSVNERIVFVRDELKPQKTHPEEIKQFVEYICCTYPALDFKLVLIIADPLQKKSYYSRFKDLEADSHIHLIHDEEPFGDWTRPHVKWNDFLI